MAARIQREPTPVVIDRVSLFTGDYFRPAWSLHPDGDRIIVAQQVTVSATPIVRRWPSASSGGRGAVLSFRPNSARNSAKPHGCWRSALGRPMGRSG